MVKVVWTNTALEDLGDFGKYIGKDSIRYAEITILELFRSTDISEDHPKAVFVVTQFGDEFIGQIVRGTYRIVYHILYKFRIDILTVHNCARLISNTKPFKKDDEI